MYRARYRKIVLFFARLIYSITVWDLILPKVGFRKYSKKTRSNRLRNSAIAYQRLAVQMGGVLIKVGQFLSTRVDVLPQEVTSELSGLQDEVPAESFAAIQRVAEAEFGAPLDEKFTYFDPNPLAAASLGQVHRARLHPKPAPIPPPPDGKPGSRAKSIDRQPVLDVVVKVQRPEIEKIIETDLAALRKVGGWLARYRPINRRVNIQGLLNEFTRILYEEIDYLAEGRNAETFAANFADQPGIRVPCVLWTHTTRRVLTLENVWGVKITEYQAITAAGVDRSEVASRLLDTYLKQIFEDGFFHADPHPGNLFVNPLPVMAYSSGNGRNTQAAQWTPFQLTFVDFGMVGHVPDNLRMGLRELLIGVGTQDAARVVQAYKMMDILLPNADLDLIEKAEARVFERFWGKSMSELSQTSLDDLREFTSEFRELIYDLPFQMPQNLIFLARAVAILSGMCTGLDPHFNVFDHLAPYTKKLMADEARFNQQAFMAEVSAFTRSLVAVPQKVDAILGKLERGEVAVRTPEFSQQINRLERTIRQVVWAIIFGASLLGGIELYLADQPAFAFGLWSLATISLVVSFFPRRRRK